jgi:DHA2 family multidrug resistance protein-like MFS transporter
MLASDGLPPAQRAWAMLTICLGVSLSSMDGLIANLALPIIVRDLHTTPAATVWVVTAYQLAVTVCILPLSALAEIVGCRRIYIAGLVLFTLGSLGCAASDTLAMLVGFRVLQGVGAAGLVSVSTALVRFAMPRDRLGWALGLYAVTVGVSMSAGPTVAAAILTVAPWPWLFAINVPIGIVTILIGYRVLPETHRVKRPFDMSAALLTALALALLVTAVDRLGVPADRLSAALEIVAGIAIGIFVVRGQRRLAHPLVPVDLMRIPLFALSTITGMGAYATLILSFVALPFFFQGTLGRGDSVTGLLITPWPLVLVLCGPAAGKLSDRFPAGILGSIGLLIMACGLFTLMILPADASNADIIWRTALAGLGFGFFQTPNNRTIMTAGPIERSGAASGMLAITRMLGMSLGAASAALLFSVLGPHGARSALGIAALIALGTAAVSFSRLATKK